MQHHLLLFGIADKPCTAYKFDRLSKLGIQDTTQWIQILYSNSKQIVHLYNTYLPGNQDLEALSRCRYQMHSKEDLVSSVMHNYLLLKEFKSFL